MNKGKKIGRSPDKDPGPSRGRLHRLQRGDKPLTDALRGLRVRRARLHVEDLADIARHNIRAAPQLARYPPQALGRVPAIPCPLHGFVVSEAIEDLRRAEEVVFERDYERVP